MIPEMGPKLFPWTLGLLIAEVKFPVLSPPMAKSSNDTVVLPPTYKPAHQSCRAQAMGKSPA